MHKGSMHHYVCNAQQLAQQPHYDAKMCETKQLHPDRGAKQLRFLGEIVVHTKT